MVGRTVDCRGDQAIANVLLASLPREELPRLLSQFSRVTLTFGEVLYEPDTPIRDVYFPSSGLVSLLTIVEGSLALEVGMVGRDGMVGSPLALGIEVSPVRALVQGTGLGLRISKARFQRALQSSPHLQRVLYGYIHALMLQISQTAACNRFHLLEERVARWLLMTSDRIGSATLHMTHELLSDLLGVRREGVSEVASAFQRQNLIEYHRGTVRILDHRGLEAAACSCYRRFGADSGAIPSRYADRRRVHSRKAPS